MAEVFKFINATLATSAIASQNIYTSPANTTSIVFMGQVANKEGSNSASFSVTATDSSGSSTKFLASLIPVPANSATTFLTGKLVLEAGDYISANANTASAVDISLSVLQLT